MQVDLKTMLCICTGMLVILGAIVGFFQMQTRQNMKIDQLRKDLDKLQDKQIKTTHYQIETEKNIVEINTKLDNIVETLKEIIKGTHNV